MESDIPSWSLEAADSKGVVEVEVSNEMILTTAETELRSPDLSKVVAFSEANFEGNFIEYSFGKNYLEIGDVSSLRIPLGFAVEVCDSARCAGFYGDVSDLLSFSDSVLNLNIYESVAFVTVFDENNFGGVHQIFPVATYLRSDLLAGIGDDKISSCHIPAGLRVKFCEHPRGGGFCDFFTSSVAQLGVELNNDVTHIEVSENTGLSITP
ncbi:MAG: hypothetical protein AB8G05_16615 [Oligoflexales bacterium]